MRKDVANLISASRMVAAAAIVLLASGGKGQIAGLVLILAGLTDVLDGLVARLIGTVTSFGMQFDTSADAILLIATAIAVSILHPQLLWAIAAAATAWAACLLVAARFNHGELQGGAAAKLGGGMLYAFALIVLLTGTYVGALLLLPIAGMVLSTLGVLSLSRRRNASADTDIIE